MKFIFVSNYINHHQKPLCDVLYGRLGDDFSFIATMPMEAERLAMGWDGSLTSLPYVKLLYEDPSLEQQIYDSDFVLFGWSEREDIAQKRLLSGKSTMRVSERIYRDGMYKAVSPRGLAAKYREHIRFRKKPVYMLCAGAYTAADFALIHAYPGKCLRWGYFPPFSDRSEKGHTPKAVGDDGIQIVWAGRFIPLKNPEYPIRLAARLKKENIPFHLHMVGSGEMEEKLKQMITDENIGGFVTMYGFKKPDEVRTIMENCHIHLCTSNRLEGWGAVVNEGMNSGCVEIVSDRMGCVPFLIKDGVNGYTYSHDSYEEMESRALYAARNWDEVSCIGVRAYETIEEEWNAETAGSRLIDIAEKLVKGAEVSLPDSGPASSAPVIRLK